MKKNLIAAVPIALVLIFAQALARRTEMQPLPQGRSKASIIDTVKKYVRTAGATIDDSKSTSSMVVSSYSYRRNDKTTIVILNDERKSLLGFYIYNFGSLKNASNREEVYKYLLSTNDAISIGSFFVDSEQDIGYKYLVSNEQMMSQAAFQSVYLMMATVARERGAEIRKLLEPSSEGK